MPAMVVASLLAFVVAANMNDANYVLAKWKAHPWRRQFESRGRGIQSPTVQTPDTLAVGGQNVFNQLRTWLIAVVQREPGPDPVKDTWCAIFIAASE